MLICQLLTTAVISDDVVFPAAAVQPHGNGDEEDGGNAAIRSGGTGRS